MAETFIKCKKIVGGISSGEAMIFHEPLSLVSEINETNGHVRISGHELEGMSVAGKVLIYPQSKGSTFAGVVLKTLKYFNCHPTAIITIKQPDHTTIQGVILAEIPTVCQPDTNILELIKTGDFIEVNASDGKIHVRKK